MAQRIRLALVGAGNVGRRFLELLANRRQLLCDDFGLDMTVVGVADSSGAAIAATGLDPRLLIGLKEKGKGVASYPDAGQPGVF